MPLTEIAAYLNFDMVGRMQDNKLTMQAAGTSPVWRSVLERANVSAGFDVVIQEDPYQPTDVATFNDASVPSLSFTTGAHVDYHKPSDTADKINYEDLGRVGGHGRIDRDPADGALDAPAFAQSRTIVADRRSRGHSRVTGTMPDYTSTAKGLLLGGVVAGGPAEQAGLAKGDVIVEIAGQSIANIYDYTFALELLKSRRARQGRLPSRRTAARDHADTGGQAIGRASSGRIPPPFNPAVALDSPGGPRRAASTPMLGSTIPS